MKLINQKIKRDGGYAILFAVVVVGIISMITIGLSNAAYKQMILSSVARDSTTAFYQADIGAECALYADNEYNMESPEGTTCAGIPLSFKFTQVSPEKKSYDLILPQGNNDSNKKCFRINVEKTESEILISTKVQALGYNICNKSNLRTVERAIEVNY